MSADARTQDLLRRLGRADALYADTDWPGAERLYHEASVAIEDAGASPVLAARARAGMGNCAENDGRFGDAVSSWQRALDALEGAGLADSLDTAALRRSLASHRRAPIVFVSYARADGDFVARIERALRRRGATVLRDSSTFVAHDIREQIDDAIRRAPSYIIAWSATYAARPYTTYELDRLHEAIFRRREGRGRRAILIRLDEAPLPQGWSEIAWLDARSQPLRTITAQLWRTIGPSAPV